ncbi:MAG: hypothetical protein ACYC4U_09215 [Pirellulaceae bacterium]
MKTQCQNARRQLEQFLAALFRPDELIEIRFIESWISRDKRRSRVVQDAAWMLPQELISQHREIVDFAHRERANVYFGVCPRANVGDSQDDHIQTVRCLWCDIDGVSAQEAFSRWNAADVPPPSLLIHSGAGIHGYWLLDRDVRSSRERSLITVMLPSFYRDFSGDHVQNLSRLLRLAGTVNYKNARSGRPPRPCTLLHCRPDVRYPFEAFGRWIDSARGDERRKVARRVCSAPQDTFRSNQAAKSDVAEIIRNLDRPSRDRSRRDFAIVCDLLRMGLGKEEIWALVADRSKFESNGRSYFDVTMANALRQLMIDGPTPGAVAASV